VSYGGESDFDFDGTDSFTIEVWAKWTTSQSQDMKIVSKQGTASAVGWFIETNRDNAGDIRYLLYDGTSGRGETLNLGLNDGNWHHLAMVNDGTTASLYVDGTLEGSDSTSVNSILTDIELQISGRNGAAGAEFFNGSIDEVRISEIARRPVSGLWTLNYTLNSTTEVMRSGNRYYWKVRALDGGGEQ